MDQLDEVTRDHTQPGAMAQLARDPASRQRFLKMVGGAGAAGAFGLFLAACGGEASEGGQASADKPSKASRGDLNILNYALTLEYVEADFYRQVIDGGLFKGTQADLLKTFGEHESQHVETLTQTIEKLGGTPAAKPETKFPLKDARSVAALASVVENLGAAAYLGQAPRIRDKEVLAAALTIHSVEARHAAALNRLTGKAVSPEGAFAKPLSMQEVLPKVKPFIVST